jgi:glycosyltransferase involved in cell wall biosynthesis
MNVIVTCEYRFFRTPDQKIWTSSAFLCDFWLRYLEVFDQVIAIARVQDVAEAKTSWKRADGNNVRFVSLPYYVGFMGLLTNAKKIRDIIGAEVRDDRALIYRVPSQSAMLSHFAHRADFGHALEVVGDPYDVFNSGITNGLLDKALGWLSYHGLKRMAFSALAACYVTKYYLQRRYPTSAGAISLGCSDIELTESNFVKSGRHFSEPAKSLVFVGSLEQLYKGPDTAIKAVSILKKAGIEVYLTMLGGGRFLSDMQTLAIEHGCDNNIQFIGEVKHVDVIQHLDANDIFIMPSLTEGLPRALIEAMARGLPCIASNVGGIPELLNEEFMVEPNQPQQLADVILTLHNSPQTLTGASEHNLQRAREYQLDKLQIQRRNFYQSYRNLKQNHESSSSS